MEASLGAGRGEWRREFHVKAQFAWLLGKSSTNTTGRWLQVALDIGSLVDASRQ